MTVDRRSLMGTLIGAATIPLIDGSGLKRETEASSVITMLEAFRNVFNDGQSKDFYFKFGIPDFQLITWLGSANAGKDGPAKIDELLKILRQRLGRIVTPVIAGQFLISPDLNLVRYYPLFNIDQHSLNFEISFLLTDDTSLDGARVRELHVTDPVRFNSSIATVVDVPSDGKRDVSVAVQALYDELVRQGGGVLQFPPGVFRLSLNLNSRNVQLRGSGRLATQLLTVGPKAVVLRGAYRSGSWDTVTISDLGIIGDDSLTGIGFRAGSDTAVKDDEFIGRTRFENVRFGKLDTCIDRPKGQIGLIIDACQFEEAKVHMAGQARQQADHPLMHAGNILVRGSHFQSAHEAVFRIDSPVIGSGQIAFQDCIMESNPGIVFDIRNLNAVDSVPAVTVSRCWNEQNGTAPTVIINGKAEKPVYARLTNCSLMRFEDTPIGPLTLSNSIVRTLDCSLDQLKKITQDTESLIEHTRARMFSGPIPPGLVDTVEATYLNGQGRGVSFTLPHRTALSHAYRKAVKISIIANQPISFSGTSTITSRSIDESPLPAQTISQELYLEPGSEIFPQPITLASGQWIAWLYIYRHMAGSVPTLSLTGSHGLTLEAPLGASDWSTLGGMVFVSDNSPSISFWHRCFEKSARLQLGGINLLAFDKRQDARDFLNSRLFAI